MTHSYLSIARTARVREAEERRGSLRAYAGADFGDQDHDRLGPQEATFIAARDSFYLASVSETGWPYVQHRGGPPGFLRVIDETTLGFADFRGNRQYLTVGNLDGDDRVSLFLMDYANRRRLKIFGHARIVEGTSEDGLSVPGYRASVERSVIIRVAGFDWNCPQHITPRFTAEEWQARA
ncbi:MAG: pyridoxamine 5'-phosphate oxidase family protein [Methylobacterium sp.]|uniref:pyridoxamine 5'-phosphate oxidase family protein n=1 Tax=Methylobacterium sp. TaxID=409 RepID=UPI0025D297D4|nr:pyridoxamine 5'-phosphate oxidase family protein [Methylobacterium sp.]MBX9933608.1 pyridoxamine 5'-phosphate oxidase family protein [Methylobacterium sp.]